MDSKRKWMRRTLFAALCVAGAAQAAELTIFKQPNFTGDALTIQDDTGNLAARNFQDQASSIEVRSGRWEFCTQPNFQGDCMTLGRGQYAALDPRLNHRIESVREVSNYADNKRYGDNAIYHGGDRYAAAGGYDRDRYDRDRHDHDRYAYNGYGRGPAVELFDGPDFSGRAVRIQGDVPSMYKRGLDDETSSMVIREGAWQVCSGDGYQGQCRVFQPGQYADLSGLDNHIGSLKRVG